MPSSRSVRWRTRSISTLRKRSYAIGDEEDVVVGQAVTARQDETAGHDAVGVGQPTGSGPVLDAPHHWLPGHVP